MAQRSNSIPSMSRRTRLKNARRSVLMWLIFLPLIFVIFIPVLYMVTMAFTTEANQFIVPIRWIPQPATLLNFRKSLPTHLCPWAAVV